MKVFCAVGLGLCKAPSSHSLFYRQLLQRLVRLQALTHQPGAVPARTDCTTVAACPACMLCWYAQYGPYTDALYRAVHGELSTSTARHRHILQGVPELRKVMCRDPLRAGAVYCFIWTVNASMALNSSSSRT